MILLKQESLPQMNQRSQLEINPAPIWDLKQEQPHSGEASHYEIF